MVRLTVSALLVVVAVTSSEPLRLIVAGLTFKAKMRTGSVGAAKVLAGAWPYVNPGDVVA